MRAIAILTVTVSFSAAAGGWWPANSVDLDRPGVLDGIAKRDRPLYDRIHGVLKAAEMEPCETLPRIVETQFRAGVEACNGSVILTSYPAKIRVAFRIDDILYSSNVIQPKIVGKALPAVNTAAPAEKR